MSQKEPTNELLERLKELGWSKTKLATRVAEIRGKEVNQIKTSVIYSLNHPDKTSKEHLEAIVKAMGGSLTLNWLDKELMKDP
jgi:hypothetical protein